MVFYAGDNDVEANHTPEQIAGDFTAFERKVHAALPATEIVFISVKPSTRRLQDLERHAQTAPAGRSLEPVGHEREQAAYEAGNRLCVPL